MKQKEIRVLMVEPGKHPRVTALQDDLDSLQRAVSIGADYSGAYRNHQHRKWRSYPLTRKVS